MDRSDGHVNPAYTPDVKDTTATSPNDVHFQISSPASVSKAKTPEDERYGCFCKPRCLQPLNKMLFYVICTVFMCFVEGYAVNGVANAARPHIEKQFGLTSSRSALITSAQDIGALSVILLVSYIGSHDKFNKARWVAIGSVVMGLGSLVFIVPHLVLAAEQVSKGPPPSGICELGNSTSGGGGDDDEGGSDLYHYLGVFMVANILHGMGYCPMLTVGTVYIDENEKSSLAAVYIGLTYAAAAAGVALGFFIGGQFTEKYYVDFDTLDQDTLGFGPRDSQWIGAWWTGFIPSVVAFIIIAIPIFGFPRHLPGRPTKAVPMTDLDDPKYTNKAKEAEEKTATSTVTEAIMKVLRDTMELALNPAFVFFSLGGAAEALIISGVGAFSFKYLAEQYDMSFDTAGNLLGGLILFSALGMVAGGFIIKCFKLEAAGMSRLNAGMAFLTGVMGLCALATCPDVKLAGLEVSYPGQSVVDGYASPCQGQCACGGVDYNPICGTDDKVYYSPCHAGCVTIVDPGPEESYSNCSCLALYHNTTIADDITVADRGRCSVDCWGLYLVAPMLFLMLFAVLITTTPTSMATLRIVPPRLKSFALGVQWIMLRLLGMIPGPPLVGWVLDEACLIWSTAPDGTTFCALYSKTDLGLGITIWWVIVNIIAAVLFFLAGVFLRCRKIPENEESATPS